MCMVASVLVLNRYKGRAFPANGHRHFKAHLPENAKFLILHQHKTKAIMTNELLIFAAKIIGIGAALK